LLSISFCYSFIYLTLFFGAEFIGHNYIDRNFKTSALHKLVDPNMIKQGSIFKNMLSFLCKSVILPLIIMFLIIIFGLFLFQVEKYNTFKKLNDDEKIQYKKRYARLAANMSFILIFAYLVYIVFFYQKK
jgi:hypothetical protein